MSRQKIDMKLKVHNGFSLEYNGWTFPATQSNSITYKTFCLKGGIANERFQKIQRNNGSHIYFTYHDCSVH